MFLWTENADFVSFGMPRVANPKKKYQIVAPSFLRQWRQIMTIHYEKLVTTVHTAYSVQGLYHFLGQPTNRGLLGKH